MFVKEIHWFERNWLVFLQHNTSLLKYILHIYKYHERIIDCVDIIWCCTFHSPFMAWKWYFLHDLPWWKVGCILSTSFVHLLKWLRFVKKRIVKLSWITLNYHEITSINSWDVFLVPTVIFLLKWSTERIQIF